MTKWHPYVERGILTTVVLTYVVLGVLYATLTPAWQVPDEPAHYNYVRTLVEERRLPILRIGDYDQAYLSEITARRFDPALSIEPIRYESHQPPLYYLLALPVYIASNGALVPLRLLSVLFGAGLLVIAYLVGKVMYPSLAWPALGTAALIAFIPQHIAMTAAVQNDALAELILGIVLLGLVRWLHSSSPYSNVQLAKIGVCIGLGLLTKAGTYVTVPLAIMAVWLKFYTTVPSGRRRLRVRPALVALAALLAPALLMGLPWFARNAAVYGDLDILGLQQHERVVVGQLRTAEWIAEHGWTKLPRAFVGTTFHSFWAQFGWMAVPIDRRIYVALGLLSALAVLGFIYRLLDLWEAKQVFAPAALLLAGSALLTLATYLGYNMTFYQAQGRYLYPALIPIGLAWSIGWHETLRPKNALTVGIVLALVALLGAIKWLTRTCRDKWYVLINGLGALLLGGRWLLPEWAGNWLWTLPYLLLAVLCAVSPFWFIVPYLAP